MHLIYYHFEQHFHGPSDKLKIFKDLKPDFSKNSVEFHENIQILSANKNRKTYFDASKPLTYTKFGRKLEKFDSIDP